MRQPASGRWFNRTASLRQHAPARIHGRARAVGRALLLLAATAALGLLTPFGAAQAQTPGSAFRIGIIGTGRIGSQLARYWAKAGHEVFVSSRHPEELKDLVAQIGPRAHAGTPQQAAAFGQVILVSVPYAAMPQVGKDLRKELAGKVIIDTSNPSTRRDGDMAVAAQKKGAGIATADFLHNRHIVRAFNCLPAGLLASQSNRQPARIAIPIGGDDAHALQIGEQLVREAGFDPVVVGSLAQTREFDLGQPLAMGQFSAAEMRAKIAQLNK